MEQSGKLLIGTAGWSYPDWEGIVYPPGLPKGLARLEFISRFVDVIEINNIIDAEVFLGTGPDSFGGGSHSLSIGYNFNRGNNFPFSLNFYCSKLKIRVLSNDLVLAIFDWGSDEKLSELI